MSTDKPPKAPHDLSQPPKPVLERTPIGDAAFSVSARVAMQLGRESISSSVTALIELVKNAYDADAEHVWIRFADLGVPKSKMVVEDDGCGMTVEDLKASWMIIGTSTKAKWRNPTKRGRVMTGEKGLGRLGLDRLCRRTRVQSETKGNHGALELEIDWTRYEGSDERLESITHCVFSLPNLNFDPLTGDPRRFQHGTRLVLEELRDQWDEQALLALRKELALLLSPFAGPKDFTVEIQSGMDWKNVDGPVSVPKFVLDAATWKVAATINPAGLVTINMSSAQHDKVYRQKPTKWSDFAKGVDLEAACGPLRFEFYFFPRKETSLSEQTLAKKDIDLFLNSNQGIRIYRDGFRVKPYGDPDGFGDWLNLSYRKVRSPAAVSRTGDWRVGYNQVIGAVFIGREKNGALLDQTNREGLVEGNGLRDLRIFASKVIEYFENRHSEHDAGARTETSKTDLAKRKAEEKARESLEALERLSAAVERLPIPSKASADNPVIELRRALDATKRSVESGQAAAKESEKAAEEELERTRGEKNTMANLASLGILTAAFGHETLGLSDSATKNAIWLQNRITADAILLAPREKDEAQRVLDELAASTAKIETFAKFALDTVSPAKRRRIRFSLKDLVNEVFKAFKDSLESQRNIKAVLRLPDDDGCIIRAYPSDWESILVNLITNSVWAMERTPKGQRQIRAALAVSGAECVLVFEDSGRGLEAGTEEQVFQPTFSTKRNEKGEVYGTGMGLTIVKSCVEENSNGTVKAMASGELGGALFEIRVPRIASTEQ